MKKYLAVLIVIACFLAGCSVFSSGKDELSPSARRSLRNGNIYYPGNLDKARKFLSEVLDEYPENIEANKKMADIYFSDAENNESIAYEKYLEAWDKYQIVYNKLRAIERKDRTRNQRRWYKDTKKKIKSIYLRIQAQAKEEYSKYLEDGSGNVELAIEKFNKTIDLDPTQNSSYVFLLKIYSSKIDDLYKEEVLDEAKLAEYDNMILGFFGKLAENEPDNVSYLSKYAKQLFNMERYNESLEEFTNLIEVDTYNFENYYYAAQCNDKLGNLDESISIMTLANTNIPENVDVLKTLALYSKQAEMKEDYINYTKQLIDLEASSPILSSFCAFLYKEKMWEELLTYSERWYVVDKKNANSARFAAYAAQQLKQNDKYKFYGKIFKKLSGK